MPDNQNEQLIRSWVKQIWNGEDGDSIGDFHPDQFQNEGRESSIGEANKWHQQMRSVYPDLIYTINEIVVAGERVTFRWSATGTHHGVLWGFIQPTGKKISWNGMHLVTVENQKIVEIWAVSNTLAQLQQMGVQLQPPSG